MRDAEAKGAAQADMDCDEAKKGDDANDPFAFGDDSAMVSHGVAAKLGAPFVLGSTVDPLIAASLRGTTRVLRPRHHDREFEQGEVARGLVVVLLELHRYG